MTASVPFVSIVVPVYNGAGVLPGCIEGCLRQSYPRDAYEVIVVDNGSTDGSRSVIEAYPVQYVREVAHQSSYAARNAGIQASKGDIIAFTDADCVPRPEWLERAVEGFQDPEVGCVAGGIVGGGPKNWVEEELVRREWLSEHVSLHHDFLPFAQTANALYRRSVFEEIGVFETTWISGGDADLSWRMQLQSPFTISHRPEAIVEHHHRSTLQSLFKQTFKWGRGNAQLEEKYGAETLDQGLSSSVRTLEYVARTLVGYGVRKGRSLLNGNSFARAAEYKVNLVLRCGLHLGWLYGRYGGDDLPLRGW